MKIPLSWLKEYLDLNISAQQIAKMLTGAGIEVEGLETPSLGFDKVVVGRVLSIAPHPDADKLCVAQVTDGIETYQVVCGAPNCRVGMKTAYAPLGATLSDDKGKSFSIKKVKLRGVESFGMLCSEQELGIGSESSGIMEFADQIQEGADVASLYADTIFEISLTPNLGHCSSVFGIARELAALTGLPLKKQTLNVNEKQESRISDTVKVTLEDSIRCPRYACCLIHGVKVGPSPDWLRKRVEECGFRSVNNIVDVTNYLLLDKGQPLHAFDLSKLENQHVIIRSAKPGEKLVTLDGKERHVLENDLLICDAVKPIAIAGVMGGIEAEVGLETGDLLLEAAHFDPRSIRQTSRRLGLISEASKRFERGTDPNALHAVLNQAAALIQLVAGGSIAEGIIDCMERSFPELEIQCRLDRINNILGTHLSVSEIENIFKKLQFRCRWNGRDAFVVTIPTYRADIHEEIDLVEEVARIYGYENIPQHDPHFEASTIPHAPLYLFENELRTRLVGEGLQEFLTPDLIGPSLINTVGSPLMSSESTLAVLNPTSIEQSVLRTSLLPALLQIVKYNLAHQESDINGFELGRIHFKKGDQYVEQTVVGIVLSGKRFPHHWENKNQLSDFYDLKGIIENLLQGLGVEGISYTCSELPIFHPGKQASMWVKELELGTLGEVHPAILRRLDVAQPILFAELNLHDLKKVRKKEWKMSDLPLYPGSDRDWTVTLSEETPIQIILDFFDAHRPKLLQKLFLLDLYRSESLGLGKKNVTFRFHYRAVDRTLEQSEIDREHFSLIHSASQQLKF